MICPECSGNGYIRVPGAPDPWETSQNPYAKDREINCPTCGGQGEVAVAVPTNNLHLLSDRVGFDAN